MISPEALYPLARQDRLYPGLILYGADLEERQRTATELARVLLCETSEERPCGRCRHCLRLTWPTAEQEKFHPDFHILKRDLRTATSAGATKNFLKAAYSAPFEARGQVFVISEAETLTPEAADALLKLLEEPPTRSPRHFMLLTASRLDLLPTLRSRSLSVFLGNRAHLDETQVATLTTSFGQAIAAFWADGATIHLLTAADALTHISGWEDPRGRRPWATAAAAVLRYTADTQLATATRRALLDFAQALLDGPRLRVRGIGHGRIIEGLLSRHLSRV